MLKFVRLGEGQSAEFWWWRTANGTLRSQIMQEIQAIRDSARLAASKIGSLPGLQLRRMLSPWQCPNVKKTCLGYVALEPLRVTMQRACRTVGFQAPVANASLEPCDAAAFAVQNARVKPLVPTVVLATKFVSCDMGCSLFLQKVLAFTCWRQVHLPKSGKGLRQCDGAIDVATHRPLTVFSCSYRSWSATRLASPQAHAWLSLGVLLRPLVLAEVWICYAMLLRDERQFLVSLDYSKAFDHVDPHASDHTYPLSAWFV